jgi:hypothetical protein
LVLRELGWKDLQGDRAVQLTVIRKVDFAHSARPDFGADLISAEFCAGLEGHAMRARLYENTSLHQFE